jgi:DNA-binding transcriptional ArsR family regulator
MYLIKKQKDQILSLASEEINPKDAKVFGSKLARRIVKSLSEKESYPKELAKELGVHEQKVYYHIRKLETANIVKTSRTETHQGATAKYYALTKPSFFIKLKEFKEISRNLPPYENKFLDPFIQNGELNSIIIMGSPDPHGEHKARSRDNLSGMDLALLLGTFVNHFPENSIFNDTQIKDIDLKQNLIILGGPIVNGLTKKINLKLPIRFAKKTIHSTITNKEYHNDKNGIIIKCDNPFDKSKKILLIAGLRLIGTRACILALSKYMEEISKPNKYDKKVFAKVIEGADINSDGKVDEIEILE